MLTWKNVMDFAVNGNPKPDKRVEKKNEQWRAQLTPEQYRITRNKGTEMAGTGALCSVYEAGRYDCVCCNTPLFDSTIKFDSGTGWPSFTQPITPNAIKYRKDTSHGMVRVEVMCNVCDAHLGHVFPDGPEPSGLRYCINSESLVLEASNPKISEKQTVEVATFGGGCFWCTEAVFQEVKGVQKVVSGYAGGTAPGKPTYKEVCSGLTGHAEVVQVTFDANILSYKELLEIFMTTHDPTTLNRQGADAGTQYRSVIFYNSDAQKITAQEVLGELKPYFDAPIVTEIKPLTKFYEAEGYHQDYYSNNPTQGYCRAVISPKLDKFRKRHADKLK
ncbi:MAG: bifunctional methionine sulfoxide reductase B/A protein [Flavobacteriaceae bacterium]